MRYPSTLLIPLAAMLLAGCNHVPLPGRNPAGLSESDAQSRLRQGLTRYKENRYDAALVDLNAAAVSGQLKTEDEINARKHMAFIHCASSREAQCREQFQAILKTDPNFDLAPNEVSDPAWGPVWRSTKVALDDQRAVARGSGLLASPALHKLAAGIKEYDAGRYNEAIAVLQEAIKSGFKEQSDEIRARKYSAFAYCLTQNKAECRNSFRSIFALSPTFELVPSEAGHPAWAKIYRKELAAARRSLKVSADRKK